MALMLVISSAVSFRAFGMDFFLGLITSAIVYVEVYRPTLPSAACCKRLWCKRGRSPR